MTGTARVLLIEDDPAVAQLVTLYLRNADFAVTHAATGAEGERLISEVHPALVILDLGLPDIDGSVLFRSLRQRSDLPVLALTARAEEKIAGLEAGMDDYVTKPFDPRELVARVRAVVRRSTGAVGGRIMQIGDLKVDPARHEVFVGEREVHLRAKEFELLEAFVRQPGVVLSRDDLLQRVWGFAFPGETRTVDVHVKQLRDKLEGMSARIETVWGVGYKLVDPERVSP
jgi:DNA-binding response OmpR family regulator